MSKTKMSSSISPRLPQLPEEIWCHIFSFLSAEDRKNIRLMSRHFNESCDGFQVSVVRRKDFEISKIFVEILIVIFAK